MAPFGSNDGEGAISAIQRTASRVFPVTGEPISLRKGDELFLEGVLISCDSNLIDHAINQFVDQDPILAQMINGQHEEIGWYKWLNKDPTRLFIAKLDGA